MEEIALKISRKEFIEMARTKIQRCIIEEGEELVKLLKIHENQIIGYMLDEVEKTDIINVEDLIERYNDVNKAYELAIEEIFEVVVIEKLLTYLFADLTEEDKKNLMMFINLQDGDLDYDWKSYYS